MNRLIRGVGALIVLAVLLVGAPLALLSWVGNPWPDGGWSEVQLLTNRTIFGALAVVGWLAWAQMSACILMELGAALRGSAPGRVKFASGGQQHFARVLVTAVVALGIGAGTGGPSIAATAAPHLATPATSTTSQVAVHAADTVRDHVSAGPAITVDRDTTVWKLAETHLEDGSRWRELMDLNRGTALSDGATLTQARQTIPAGTTFRLPAGVHVESVTDAHADAPAPARKAAPKTADNDYTVKPSDTLWEIADEKLDDPTRYMELFDASAHTVQPGGQQLVDPDHIEAGWTITIPGTGGTVGGQEHADQEPTQHNDTRGSNGGQGAHADKGETQTPQTEPATPSETPAEAAPDSAGDETEGQVLVDDVDEESNDENILDASWVLPGLTGGGVLLAGSLFLGLQSRRRAQFRSRRPGRAIAGPPPELAPAEMTINAAGGRTAATVAFMDEALRRLAEHNRIEQTAMPPVAAAQLHGDLVTLHLSGPAHLPAPWQGSPDQLHWSCSTSTPAEDLGPAEDWAEAPYPMLVTVGLADGGDLWLLNCEELGTVEVAGDPERARDFARHLAAQLAVNPWSQHVSVDCVGIAEEIEALGDRVRYYSPGHPADRATAEVLADAVSMVDRSSGYDTDVSTGRTGAVDDDVWPARMLLVAADAATDTDGSGDVESLGQLRDLVTSHVGRTGTAIVITGADPQQAGTVIRMTPEGRVVLERQGLDLAAVGLSSDEAHACALLYAHSEDLQDVEAPVDVDATEGWEAYVDQSGALRREYTLPRSTQPDEVDEPMTSLLEGADEEYIAVAAAVAEDLEAVAPKVAVSVLAKIKEEDPALDADLADWFDPDSPRPKLSLLGDVTVRTHGRPLSKYKAMCTEIVAYLALRPNGATRDELAEALGWGDPNRVRKYVDLVRHWLGEDPDTEELYLPHASKSPAAKVRGGNIYQVTDGLLTDFLLFKRLRARGTHADLLRALELVTGRPFGQLREGGWNWLRTKASDDQDATRAIADVAFTVVTHCLHEGDLGRARAAAELAILAVPNEQVVQLCQVAVTEAEGNSEEAMRILLEDVCNRAEAGEAPLDLPERTQEIIRNQQWLAS